MSRKNFSISIICSAFLFLLSCGSLERSENDDIIRLADPTIFFQKDTYYLYGTGAARGFKVYTSKDKKKWKLSNATDKGFALKKGNAFGDHKFWAPQVFQYGDRFYMAYSANESIAIAQAKSPFGPFTQEKKVALKAPVKQIDPFVFIDEDGKKYLYHVRVANGANRIFVARLKDDLSGIVEGSLKKCIEASESWENTENSKWSVTEGPSVLKKGDRYFLFYSANDFRSPDYAVGYAVASDPMGPWKKYEGNPILSRNNINKNGTGHGDFFKDRKGNFFYVFHTHESEVNVSRRKTAMVKLDFSQDKKGETKVQVNPNSFFYLKQHR